jgi:hypothetical protein
LERIIEVFTTRITDVVNQLDEAVSSLHNGIQDQIEAFIEDATFAIKNDIRGGNSARFNDQERSNSRTANILWSTHFIPTYPGSNYYMIGPPAIFTTPYGRTVSPRQNFNVSGDTANNLSYTGRDARYEIGWFRGRLNISEPHLWARPDRSAEEGFLLTMWTLEFGSANIHVPRFIRTMFNLSPGAHFIIQPRRMLSDSINTISGVPFVNFLRNIADLSQHIYLVRQ